VAAEEFEPVGRADDALALFISQVKCPCDIKSILFVDDCIISGTTARLCCEALVALGNHVDGLIWVYAGR